MRRQQLLIAGLVLLGVVWLFRKPIATVTTSETFDLAALGGLSTYSNAIRNMGQAIAYAEGYYESGSVPARTNNPGDLKLPDSTRTTETGITIFDSIGQGWQALYHQLQLIVTGRSNVYALDMTLADMGQWWAAGDPNWARNVATYLNVPTSTQLWAVLV